MTYTLTEEEYNNLRQRAVSPEQFAKWRDDVNKASNIAFDGIKKQLLHECPEGDYRAGVIGEVGRELTRLVHVIEQLTLPDA